MSEQKPLIEISGMTFTYSVSETPALRDINLTIYEGEYVALLGLNGAGKTTLLLTLNGVIPNMIVGDIEGAVLVDGLDTLDTTVREMAKTIGMVFDNPEFQLSQMTVDEEIALGLENLGVDHATMVDTIAEVLQTVGLTGVGERSPFQLSGGQQQRLAIASALAMRPRILVMDEPTSNVDPIGKEEIFQTARKLNQEQGMTVIVAEHEVEVMAANADRIVVLDKGRVILNGTPEEVFSEVDTLMDIGLRVPQVTEFAHLMRREGLIADRPLLPVTIDVAEGMVREIGNPVEQERRNG